MCPVPVDGDSPQQQVRGTDFVHKGPTPTGSPTYPLDVLAAVSDDRKRFLISIVKPTEEGHNLTARIRGISESELDHILSSFSAKQCVTNRRLVDVLTK